MIRIDLPLAKENIKFLKVGDEVLLSGVIYTARDAAHKRLDDLLKKGRSLPIELKTACIYYAGPTPARPGMAIGSCGPTTSSRMDVFTPRLMARGLIGMIGKGPRSEEVRKAIKKDGGVYFLATGGIGALLSEKVLSSKVIAYADLGTEAIHRLEIKDFPVIVGIDPKGRDIYAKA
jgi:fumarate hydratase subunit beta